MLTRLVSIRVPRRDDGTICWNSWANDENLIKTKTNPFPNKGQVEEAAELSARTVMAGSGCMEHEARNSGDKVYK